MYNASAQFHSAVYGNSPVERVLFKFADGTIFTNEDIHIGSGLKLIEAVNLEEELTIGGCPASSLEATIMNYHGLLSGFAFGEAEVSLGVRTETSSLAPVDANVVAVLRYGESNAITFTGHDTVPYLRVDGEASTEQPPFAVKSILIVGSKVYCISADGSVWCANWVDGYTWNELEPTMWASHESKVWDEVQGRLVVASYAAPNAFMTAKLVGWAADKRGMAYDDGILYEFAVSGVAERYEYVKLGTFLLNTPTKRKVNLISVSALDRMAKFDVAADAFWNGLTYPVTIGQIFTQLCTFVGVPQATTSFINSTRSFSEAPMVAEGITAREILKWIAEAACSFARMTRDGEVELAWFGTRPVTIPMTQYFGMSPAEYEVAPIDKLQISGSATDIGVIIGEGENGYQILDNPLLYGETDTEIRTLGVPIFNRLAAYAAFSPVAVTAVCDWSIQAGDIIEIVLNGVTYALPVYSQTITWKGNARVSYESSGAEKRPVMAATNRRVYAQKRAIHEVNETVDGLTRRIENTEGDITSLELTAAGLSTRVSNAEGDITSLEALANSLTLSVTNGSTSSTLKLMAGSTELSSANIKITGMVTFANLTDGVTQISGGNIKTGTIAAARIDVNNLYVKHLDAASGTFTGELQAASGTFAGTLSAASGTFKGELQAANGTFKGSLSGANGTFSSLSAASGLVSFSTNYINIDGIQVGYYPGYNEVGVYSPSHQTGNLGAGNLAWDQCVARRLYSASGSVNSYSMRKLKHDIARFSLPDGYIDKFEMSKYIMNDDPDQSIQIGLIADDVQEISEYLVEAFQDDSMSEPILTLDYSKCGVIAIDEIQKLRKRVKLLEETIGGEAVG